jgi:hypothetical protein
MVHELLCDLGRLVFLLSWRDFRAEPDDLVFFFLKYSYSPLHFLIQRDEGLQQLLEEYNTIPYEKWNGHHLWIENYLISQSLVVPLFYVKRHIPFSINLVNMEIRHFGYVNLARLWTRPGI